MFRKLTHKTQALHGIALFIAVLTILVTLTSFGQMANVGQPSVPPVFVTTRHEANTRQHRFSTGAVGVGGVSESRSQEKRFGIGAADTPDPLFLPGVPYYSGGFYAPAVAIADLNGDGKLDVLVATSPCYYRTVCGGPGSVGVLLGNGDGTLQPAVTYASGGAGLVSVAVADVNGDGKPDLLLVNSCAADDCAKASVGVLLGNGDGTFQTAVTYDSGGVYPSSVAVADLNGDGIPDLVVANDCASGCEYPGPGTVAVLLGRGDGTFRGATVYGSGGYYDGFIASSVAIADVNGDHKPDLIVATPCAVAGSCTSGSVAVLVGNGDGTFQPAVAYDSGGFGADAVTVADVNGDGRVDLLVANYCTASFANGNCSNPEGAVGVLLGNGDGTFQPALPYDSGGTVAVSIAVGDMNGDGRPDLLVANLFGDSVGVMLNDTGPHTPTSTTLVSNRNPATIVQMVTYTATVASQSGGIAGLVTFYDGIATIAAVSPINSQATYSVKYKKIGAHTITAAYSGDLHNSGSTSASVTEYIDYPSKTVLSTSESPTLVGQPVTFTATVMSTYGRIPDGEMVTFSDGSATLGSVAVADGTAAYTTSALSGKTHTIKATYAGDATFESSTGSVMQVVDKYPTTTVLSSSSNPSAYGQAVTFTAAVTPTGHDSPTGKMWFKDGTTGIGTVTLSAGVATLTKSKLVVGTHPITAEYLGDADSAKSTSSVLDQVVQ